MPHTSLSSRTDYLDEELDAFDGALRIKKSHLQIMDDPRSIHFRPKGECRKVRYRSRKDALQALRTIKYLRARYEEEGYSHLKVERRAYRCCECAGGYHLTSIPINTKHEIDSPTGAFFLVRKDIVDVLGGFDEHFFMYGEDLDLAFRIKRLGYAIIYNPICTVLHLKNQSGMKRHNDAATQKKTRDHFYDSMAIFYRKHYENRYPSLISKLVYMAINKKKSSL